MRKEILTLIRAHTPVSSRLSLSEQSPTYHLIATIRRSTSSFILQACPISLRLHTTAMSSDFDPVSREAELARLPGPKLVHHLRYSILRADYDAAERVLEARDRRLEAALAENGELQRKYEALLVLDAEAQPRPRAREEAEEMLHQPPPAPFVQRRGTVQPEKGPGEMSKIVLHSPLRGRGRGRGRRAREGDDDDVPLRQLRQRWKRRRQGEPRAVESEKVDGQGQHSSGVPIKRKPYDNLSVPRREEDEDEDEDDTVPLRLLWKRRRQGEPRAAESGIGDDLRKCSHVRINVPEERAAQIVGNPKDSKSAPFVQRGGTVQPEKGAGEMSKIMLHSPVRGSMLQKGFREQDKRIGGVEMTKVLQGGSGIWEHVELQKKSANCVSNDVLKCQDNATAIVVKKGDLSMQSYSLAMPVVGCVPSVTTNLQKGNSKMCNAPGGSSGVGSRNGVPEMGVSHLPKGNGQMNKTSMVESSSRCGNKNVRSYMQKGSPLLSQIEEVSFEETRVAAVPSLSFCSLSGQELADGKLSNKLVSEGSPKYGENNNNAGSQKRSSQSRQTEGAKIIGERSSDEEPRVATLPQPILSNCSTDEQNNSISKNSEVCHSTARKSLSEPGSSCTPLKRVILPPSSSKSTSIKEKRQTSWLPSAITRCWESDGHMTASLVANMELSMQALCALYRQRKLVPESNGGQTETTGLSKSDTYRATQLAIFLLDRDFLGPVKRTAEEVVSHDATLPILLQKVAISFSKVLFDIYRNKEDPYFC
ncbi:hypothetical protein GUJ93_ZPchr0001g30230 [Zizania palustris]|uniref:Uncharacterized protein n=1 Tax=Zizania palustris TaxID=103762 RepID=A0A8J5S0M6_ZIZPA|nr:hypothetical protein GUJ93_ZPchr0001g30230 [Zizania palustris]